MMSGVTVVAPRESLIRYSLVDAEYDQSPANPHKDCGMVDARGAVL